MLENLEIKSPATSLVPEKLSIFEVIRMRRATRSFFPQKVSDTLIRSLVELAIQAPSAMNQQAWSFAVVQNTKLLKEISDQTKSQLSNNPDLAKKHAGEHGHSALQDPSFDIFYGASTLIVICGKTNLDVEFSPETDCFLAGENLMLAAIGLGLATCPIGLARNVLREASIAERLGIDKDFTAVLPIVVGYASAKAPAVKRNPAVIQWTH